MTRKGLLAFTLFAFPLLLGTSQCVVQHDIVLTLPAWTVSHSGPVGLDHKVILSSGETYVADPVNNTTWKATVPVLTYDPITLEFAHVGLLPGGTSGGWGYFTGDPAGYPQASTTSATSFLDRAPETVAACPTLMGKYAITVDPSGALSTPDADCVRQPSFDYVVTGYNHAGCTLYIRLGHVIQFGPIGLAPNTVDGMLQYSVQVKESLSIMEGSYITNPNEHFWFEEYCGGSSGLHRIDQSVLKVSVTGTVVHLDESDSFSFTYDPTTGGVIP